MPYGDTKFHSGEFGNELERFLYNYDLLKTKTVNIEKTLPANQRDGFFEIVKYPISRLPSSPKKSWRHRRQETSFVRACSRRTMKPRLPLP